MNVRSFDLLVRSLTTAVLAVGVLVLAGYEVVHTGTIETTVGSFAGLVFGFYYGAHVSQNGSSARGRRDQMIAAEVTGTDPPPDEYGTVKDAVTRNPAEESA